MYLKLGRVKIHVSFLFAAFFAAAATGTRGERLMTVFASALLHECAHLCFLLSYGKTGIGLELRPGGAKITGGGYETLPYSQGLACAIAGPAVNALIAAGMFAASRIFCSERLFYAAAVNAALAGANLIPLSFLDGGRALMCVLAIKKSRFVFFRNTKRTDRAIIAVMFVAAAVLTAAGRDAVFLLVFALYCAVQSS